MSIVIFMIYIEWRSEQMDVVTYSFRFPILLLEITATDSAQERLPSTTGDSNERRPVAA